MARLTDSLTILKRHQKDVADIIDAKRAGEKIGKEKLLQEMLKISAEPYSDRPLTPKEVEEKQKKLPPGSPYEPGKSPIPSSPNLGQETLKIRPNEEVLLASASADLPLGDGLIKQGLTEAQQSNKEKYDLMYQEGFLSREQYEKQMKRTFGKNYQQYLVD